MLRPVLGVLAALMAVCQGTTEEDVAFNFRYPYAVAETLEPWRDKLGDEFETVVSRLSDRDRYLEDYVSREIGQGIVAATNNTTVTTNVSHASSFVQLTGYDTTITLPEKRRVLIQIVVSFDRNNSGDVGYGIELRLDGSFLQASFGHYVPSAAGGGNTTHMFYAEIEQGQHELTVWVDSVAASGTTTQMTFYPTSSSETALLIVTDIGPVA